MSNWTWVDWTQAIAFVILLAAGLLYRWRRGSQRRTTNDAHWRDNWSADDGGGDDGGDND